MGKLGKISLATVFFSAVFCVGFFLLLGTRLANQPLRLPSEDIAYTKQGSITSDPTLTNGMFRFHLGKLQVIGHSSDELFYGNEVFVSGILTPAGVIKQAEISLISTSNGGIAGSLHRLNTTLAPTASKFLAPKEAAIINGMVLGVKPKGQFFFTNAMRKTGTIHILVVSGSNLTLVGGFLLGFRRYLGRHLTIVLTLGVIWFYALLTGGQAPVMRAAIMLTITFIAELFGKQRWDFYALVLTAIVMIFSSPTLITDISFQLSFGATFGLILFAKSIAKQVDKVHFGWVSLKKLPFGVADNLATTLAVQLIVDPLLLYYFHQFSVVAVLANLMVLPLVLYLTLGGAVLIILGSVTSAFGIIVSLFLVIPVTYFSQVIIYLSQLPFASLTFDAVPLAFVVNYYCGLTIVVVTFIGRTRVKTMAENGTIRQWKKPFKLP